MRKVVGNSGNVIQSNQEVRYDPSTKRLIVLDNEGNKKTATGGANSPKGTKQPSALVITSFPRVISGKDLVNKPNSIQPQQNTNNEFN